MLKPSHANLGSAAMFWSATPRGGKVAQIVAGHWPKELVGMVLIAPAPPTPMPVPEAVRAGMLQSYGSRDGVLQALAVLGGEPLSSEFREQVIEDTLRGAPEAKRAWTERGMILDYSRRMTQPGKTRIPLSPGR